MLVSDFQSVQDLPHQEQDLMCYLLQIKYRRSQIRTRRSVSVENRGVADMPRSEESLKFEDQQIDINKHVDCQKHLLNWFGEQINFF